MPLPEDRQGTSRRESVQDGGDRVSNRIVRKRHSRSVREWPNNTGRGYDWYKCFSGERRVITGDHCSGKKTRPYEIDIGNRHIRYARVLLRATTLEKGRGSIWRATVYSKFVEKYPIIPITLQRIVANQRE